MPRIPEKDINYAEVGRWVLKYWRDQGFANELEDNIRKKVETAYATASKEGEMPQIKVIFEQPGEFCVVIPHCPWYDDPACWDCIELLDCYQRELGMVVFAGCR